MHERSKTFRRNIVVYVFNDDYVLCEPYVRKFWGNASSSDSNNIDNIVASPVPAMSVISIDLAQMYDVLKLEIIEVSLFFVIVLIILIFLVVFE